MQAQLAEAGITMKIKLVDSAALLSDGNNKNFEMISYQWSGRPDPDGNTFQFFKTAQGIRSTGPASRTRRSTRCSTRPARSPTRTSGRRSSAS